jgi:hypothetical protein
MYTFGGRRIALEYADRAAGPLHQFTPAVGADQLELVGCTGDAEGAFKSADNRIGGVRRQVLVATLTRRPKFKHGHFLCVKKLLLV